MVKVAVVGNEQQHLETWSKMQHVDVVAVVPLNNNELVQEVFKYKVIEHVQDVKTMDVDVVDLCVAVNERAELIRQLSKEGIHIICGSPLASTLEEASAIIRECEEKNVHLYVGNKRRFAPEYADARNQVNNGNIGKIGVIRLSSGTSYPGGQEDIFSGLGISEFEWLLWSFGDVERVMAKHVKKERRDGRPVEYALVSIRMGDHSFAHLELSWAKSEKEASFEITGNKGMLTHNSKESNPISIQLSGNSTEAVLNEMILAKSALERQFEHVVALAEVQSKPVTVAYDALKPIQIVKAARKSAKTGQPVLLEEVLI